MGVGEGVLKKLYLLWWDTNLVLSNYYTDAKDDSEEKFSETKAIWRWIPDMSEDWKVRADWSLKSYSQANHYPIIKLQHSTQLRVREGNVVTLDASDSTDPDSQQVLSYYWWHYRDAGLTPYGDFIQISKNRTSRASFVRPIDARGKDIHIILEVKDTGFPPLKAYKRIIISD